MSFNTFCNICFIKEHIIKLRLEENESISNILISFTSCRDTLNGIIYLCINCCNKLEEYNKFRELFLTNFVRFRYLYNEHKKQLEIRNVPDIEKQLQTFIDINVERPSGTPLIENYEPPQPFTNCQVKWANNSFTPSQENITENSIYIKGEPPSFDETDKEITNTDTLATPGSCSSSTFPENCNLLGEQRFFEIPDTNLQEVEPDRDIFEDSHDPFVSDTLVDVILSHGSGDEDNFDASSNTENCITEDSTGEEVLGHIEKPNKPPKIEPVCSVCNKRLSCKSDLEVHMRTHTGERPYSCDECNKTFLKRSHLIQHKVVHTGERPYECDECGLRYTKRYYLTRHKLTHSAEKPFSCDECQKSFTQYFTLIKHKRIHSGERPHTCMECGFRFKSPSHLNRHKLIHTGEKPYSCDECNKTFADTSNLMRHKRIHASEKE